MIFYQEMDKLIISVCLYFFLCVLCGLANLHCGDTPPSVMVLLYILLGFRITKLAQVSTEKVSGIKYLRLKTFERGRRGWRKEFPLQYHRNPFGEEGIRDVQVFLIYSGDK